MSWSAILLLGALAYAFKAGGLLVLDHVKLPDSVATVTALLPPALLAALVVVQTFAVAVRAPFLVVVLSAAGVTAAIRALV